MIKKIEKNLIIGSVQFTKKYGFNKKKVPLNEIKKILKYLNKQKIDYIDEAIDYNFLKYISDKKLDISKKKIITKIPSIKNEKEFDNLTNILRSSLSRNKKNSYYAILLHDTINITKNKLIKNLEYLSRLKKKKLTLYTGVSLYNLKDFFKIIKFFKPDIVQVPINIVDREFLDEKFKVYIKKNKVQVHARSIFLQGSFLQKKNNFLKLDKQLKLLDNICEKYKISRIDALVSYVLNLEFVNKIVIGVADLDQLKEIIQSRVINFKKDEFSNMKVVNKIKKPYLWNYNE